MSVKHDHEHERKEHMMSRLQHQQPQRRVDAPESSWTLWHISGSWQGHPRNTGARQGRPWVAHNKLHTTTTDKRQQDTDKLWDKRAFSNRCNHTLGFLQDPTVAWSNFAKPMVDETMYYLDTAAGLVEMRTTKEENAMILFPRFVNW